MPCLRVVRGAEAERIHIGDGARAHGEHVAHDAADACRRPLIGLDVRGVVVALHLEYRRLTVADIDHARILSRALDHLRAFGGELFQPHPRRFIGAVLGPHHRENAELGEARFAAECCDEQLVFVGRQPMLPDDVLGEGIVCPGRSRRDVQWSVSTSERNILAPSVPESAASASRSGCGISPSTVPVSL